MAERPNKRQRSVSKLGPETEHKVSSPRSSRKGASTPDPSKSEFTSTRPRRAASGASVTIDRDIHDDEEPPEEAKKALKLNFKMPSSKLREATSASSLRSPEGLQDSLTHRENVSGPRSTRNKKKNYVVESDSDEMDEDEPSEADVGDDEDEDLEESPQKNLASDDENEDPNEEDGAEPDAGEDAEEEVDADGDVDMDEDADDGLPLGPAPPKLKVKGPASKPTVTVTPAKDTKFKSVEAKEMEMDEDDEELSELQSDEDDELDAGAIDAEGDEDAEGDVDDMDEGDESRSLDPGSRGSTPDVSKMTKRQRSRLDQVMGSDFLQLPMEPQIKKHFTAEEHAMRRAEMARRRKNLSEKRNEEEKADTINRLLKKQAPKRRGKISAAEIQAQDRNDDEEEPVAEEEEEIVVVPANPVYTRWISNAQGCSVSVPTEWLGTPVGRVFEPVKAGKMVEEVEG